MGKYDFIKQGSLPYGHNPDNGSSDGAYRVISTPELSPIRTPGSRKEDFQSWKGILILKLLCANIAAGRQLAEILHTATLLRP